MGNSKENSADISTEQVSPVEGQETTMNKPVKGLNKFFGISEKGSSYKVEIFAGIATFLAMCYILTVNPNMILWAGTASPLWSSIFLATAFGAIIGTLLMSLLAKMPYAQAPGMGLNSVVGGVIGGGIGLYGTYVFEFSFGNAMLMVLISGILFLFLSVCPAGKNKAGVKVSLRERIFDGMPVGVRLAIPAGIGLFIAFIGMQNAELIIADEFVLVSIAKFANIETALGAVVCLTSLITIAVLSHYKVKGAVIIGVLVSTLLAWALGVTNIDIFLGKTEGVTWKFWENFGNFFSFNPENGGSFMACFVEGFKFPVGCLFTVIMLVITFCMIDMFDTMGTLVGCASKAGLLDETGKPLNYSKCMYADSIATVAGSLLGTSTVTTFVESGTGIAVGGKTGMTSLVVAILFALSIFLLPVFAFIPISAAAGALIYVGVLMLSSIKNIDFTDIKVAVPAFMTVVMMPLSYSITNGIGCGILTYCLVAIIIYVIDIIKFASKKDNANAEKPVWPVSWVTGVVAILFLVYFLVPTVI